MNKVQLALLEYLFKNGVKEFDGEILPNRDIPLTRISKECNMSFDELYGASQELAAKGLLKIVDVVKEVGNSNVIAVRVEITVNGIEYMTE